MRGSSTMFASAAMLLTLSVTIASPASAQLGRLKKIATDAAKDAAKEKAGVKEPESSQNGGGAKIDYTITEDRANAVLASLAPYVETAKREMERKKADAAIAAAKAEHQAKVKTVSDCITKFTAGSGMPDMGWMQTPKGEALTSKMQTVGARSAAATQSGNRREQLALTDTMSVLMVQQVGMMFPKSNCGSQPYMSKALLDYEVANQERLMKSQSNVSMPSGEDGFVVPPNQRAGMTSGQFGRVREAIAIWLLQQSGDVPPTAYKFTDAEKAVLTAKAAQLKDLGPLFKTNALTWASWGDIKAW